MGPAPRRRVEAWGPQHKARSRTTGALRGTFDATRLYEVDDSLEHTSGRTRYLQRRDKAPAPRVSEFGSYLGSHPGATKPRDKGYGVSSVGYQPGRLIGGGALDGGRDRLTQFSLPLQDACWRDDVGRVVALLRRGARVDARELYKEKQAIHVACEANAVRALKALLAHGADVDALAVGDYTPLHACCGPTDAIECLTLLLRNGAAVVADGRGRTALHVAKAERADRCYRALLPFMGRTARPASKPKKPRPAGRKKRPDDAWEHPDAYRARRNGSRLRPPPGGDAHVVY